MDDGVIAKDATTVSVIVPVYNAAEYISETLNSLLRLEGPVREIIVVDDGSSDCTYELVNQLAGKDSRISPHRLLCNQGVSVARNFGVTLAQGEWILFFDGDDIASEQLIMKQLDRVHQLKAMGYGDVVLVHSAYQQIDGTGRKIQGVNRSKQLLPQEVLGYFFLRNYIITASGVLVRKEAMINTGGFNPDIHYSEDWDLWLRLAQYGGFGYVDEPLLYVRRHQHNTSKSVEVMKQGEKRILDQYGLELIHKAIFQRDLPCEVNNADYGAMLFRLERWEEGYTFLRQALSQNSAFASGQFLTGLYYLKQQKWTEAQQSFEQTLKVAEGHGAALNNLGALLAAKGDKAKALSYLNRALELFPGYLDAARNRELIISRSDILPHYSELSFTWRELRPVLLAYAEK